MYDAYDMMMRTGSRMKGRDKVERTGPGFVASGGLRVDCIEGFGLAPKRPQLLPTLCTLPLLAHQIAHRFKVNPHSSSKELLHYVILTSHRQAAVAC